MGISRACASKWVNRWRRHGELSLHDRSSTPHHSPTATPAHVVALIETGRREKKWSAHRITHELSEQGIQLNRRSRDTSSRQALLSSGPSDHGQLRLSAGGTFAWIVVQHATHSPPPGDVPFPHVTLGCLLTHPPLYGVEQLVAANPLLFWVIQLVRLFSSAVAVANVPSSGVVAIATPSVPPAVSMTPIWRAR